MCISCAFSSVQVNVINANVDDVLVTTRAQGVSCRTLITAHKLTQ